VLAFPATADVDDVTGPSVELVGRAVRRRPGLDQVGDVEADFGDLYRLHIDDVYGFAFRRLRDHEAAEDVAADAFLVAWRRRDAYRPDAGDFGAWVLGIARNIVLRRCRQMANAPLLVDLSTGAPDPSHVPAHGMGGAEVEARSLSTAHSDPTAELALCRLEVERVWAAIRALAPMQRRALALRLGRDLSAAEAAARMGVSVDALRGATLMGLRRLREHLGAAPPHINVGHFRAWCASHGVEALPATPDTIVGYLTDVIASGRSSKTVDGRATAITTAHTVAGLESPCSDPAVRSLLSAHRQREAAARAAA
jgi:RNA polymerase sigma-70 factor, ECF subfamily